MGAIVKTEIVAFCELSIGSLAAFKLELLAAIERNDVLSLDVEAGAARADVASVQFIVAARHFAEIKGKAIRLAAPAHGALLEVLENAGFVSADAGERTFWLHQETIQ
jgi:hypothetical protein